MSRDSPYCNIFTSQSGKAHPSNRFDGEMIAHLNLFRVPMIDHRKRFDGEMIALLTSTLFRWSIIGNSLAGRWSALSAEGWSLETVWRADDQWIVDLVNWSSYYVTSALTVALSTRSTIFQSINLKSIVKKWTEDSRLPSGLTLGSFHFLTIEGLKVEDVSGWRETILGVR